LHITSYTGSHDQRVRYCPTSAGSYLMEALGFHPGTWTSL